MDTVQHGMVYITKFLIVAGASAVPALGFSLFEKFTGWYLENSWFMVLVFAAVIINHFLASYVHWIIIKDWNGRANVFGFLRKLSSVIIGYILFEMIREILKDVDFVAVYIKMVIQLTVLLWPVHSGLKKISIITGGKWPPGKWFKILDGFNEDLDLTHFKTNKNKDESANTDPGYDAFPPGMPEPCEDQNYVGDEYGGDYYGGHAGGEERQYRGGGERKKAGDRP